MADPTWNFPITNLPLNQERLKLLIALVDSRLHPGRAHSDWGDRQIQTQLRDMERLLSLAWDTGYHTAQAQLAAGFLDAMSKQDSLEADDAPDTQS